MELNNDSPFFTTSDLLKTINNVIKDTGPNSNNDGNTATQSGSEGFELQRRMPDGSTRRADEGDIALADFQSKMKQVSVTTSFYFLLIAECKFVFFLKECTTLASLEFSDKLKMNKCIRSTKVKDSLYR